MNVCVCVCVCVCINDLIWGYVPLEDSSSHHTGYVPQLLTPNEVLALKSQEKEE